MSLHFKSLLLIAAITVFIGWGVAIADSRHSGKADKISLTSETEFIEQWYVCGPFPRRGSTEMLNRWARAEVMALPAWESFARERYKSKTGASGWVQKRIESIPMASADPKTKKIRSLPTRMVNFQACYPEHLIDSSAYALAFIDTPTSQTRTLLMGSDDGIRVWLNGQCIHHQPKERPLVPDEDFAIAKFKPGINILLVEVTNANGYWGFMLRMHGRKAKAPTLMMPDISDFVK